MRGLVVAAAAGLLVAGGAQAREYRNGGKLLLTGGVSSLEGSGGGGLASWATITGYDTQEGVGGNLHATYVKVPDFSLRTYGAAIGLFDRVEVSYARQEFDTGATGAKLGLGRGFTFDQDVVGAKVRLAGDVLFDRNPLMPQIAVGAQYKVNDQSAVVRAVGARRDNGVDYYLAATKVVLDKSLVLNATLRWTEANQTGLLGFGGSGAGYATQFEGSAGWLVSKRLLIGGEYRSKPSNLAFAKEDDWVDLFAAYAVNKHLSVTAAYVDLGAIATFKDQRGVYLSLQTGF